MAGVITWGKRILALYLTFALMLFGVDVAWAESLDDGSDNTEAAEVVSSEETTATESDVVDEDATDDEANAEEEALEGASDDEVVQEESVTEETDTSTLSTMATSVAVSVSSMDDLADALDDASENATSSAPYVITLAAGTYTLATTLYIPSNTTLVATGCTIKQSSSYTGVMLRTGIDASDIASASGYAYANITVTGGTWNKNGHESTLFQICHAKNVTVQNATFTNVEDGHLMETAGVNGLTVSNCDFTKQVLNTDADESTYEALQIDILQNKNSDGSGSGHLKGYAREDLANKNISITSCDFSNVPRGIGSHTAVLNNPINGLAISGCTFDDIGSAAVQLMAVKNCTITGNTITDAARGIFVYTYRTTGTFLATSLTSSSSTSTAYKTYDASLSITSNTISLNSSEDAYDPYSSGGWQKAGILVAGLSLSTATEGATTGGWTGNKLPAGNYYLTGATIKNNTVKATSAKTQGIRLNDVRNSAVSGNTVSCSKTSSKNYWGISVCEASSGDTVTSNTVTGFYDGVMVYEDSTASSVKSNTIKSSVRHGIFVYDGAKATTIASNTISSSGQNGIYLYSGSKSTDIKSNKITSAGKYGIGVDGSTATNIKSNTITSAKNYGIMIYNKAKVTKVSSNTISKCSKDAIHIYVLKTSSSYGVTVSSNKITGKSKGTYGIWASKSYVSSSSNTIKSCSYPIYYTSTTKGSISTNTIKSNKYNKYKIGGKTTGNYTKVKGLKVSKKTKSSLTLKWSKVSTAKGYQVYRATSKSGTYSKKKTIKSKSTTTWKNSSLSSGTTYYYKVRAYKKVGNITIYGSYSTIKSGKTK